MADYLFLTGAAMLCLLPLINVLPLSLPSLVTVSLFVIGKHWNSCLDGIICMTTPATISCRATCAPSSSTRICSP